MCTLEVDFFFLAATKISAKHGGVAWQGLVSLLLLLVCLKSCALKGWPDGLFKATFDVFFLHVWRVFFEVDENQNHFS